MKTTKTYVNESKPNLRLSSAQKKKGNKTLSNKTKFSGFRETIFSEKGLSEQREFALRNISRNEISNFYSGNPHPSRNKSTFSKRKKRNTRNTNWMSDFYNNGEEIKSNYLSKENRMRVSVVRNLLDSSDPFYIDECKRTQREHSRELMKQIQENEVRKKRQTKENIDYERRLEIKIRKGQTNQT